MGIEQIIEIIVYEYLWGIPLIVIVLAGGIFFTFASGMIQFKFFSKSFKMMKESFQKNKTKVDNQAGVLSSFEAISGARRTTIGAGYIGGVAAAMAIAGLLKL